MYSASLGVSSANKMPRQQFLNCTVVSQQFSPHLFV